MTDRWPTISALIPTRNRPESLRALADNLRSQDYPADRLMITAHDDHSDVPYPDLGPGVECVRNSRRLGQPRTRNVAIERARGELILFLDDDGIIPEPTFLSRLVEVMLSNHSIGMVTPRKMDRYRVRGVTVEKERSCARPVLHSGDLRPSREHRGPVPFGGNFGLYRRDALRQVGGFDAVYGLGTGYTFREESDAQARLGLAGYTLYYEPDATIIHNIGDVGGYSGWSRDKFYWLGHNHIVFLRRYFRAWPLLSAGWMLDLLMYSWTICRNPVYFFVGLQGIVGGLHTASLDRRGQPHPLIRDFPV